jgi:micrococcal nuclease
LPVEPEIVESEPLASVPMDALAVQVVRVVDGDTIVVSIEGLSQTVRYIGVDTPETVHPTRPVECYGPEASIRNKALVEGQTVYLERDITEIDRFGRLLRYIWLENGTLVNLELVAGGYAEVNTFPPDDKYEGEYISAQRQAIVLGLGMWGACLEVSAAPDSDSGSTVGDCDPSYLGVCIPPYPPDLDCSEIAFRRFVVTGSDPHSFDGDGNGLGCES